MTQLWFPKRTWRKERERQVCDEQNACRYRIGDGGKVLLSPDGGLLYTIKVQDGKKSLLLAPDASTKQLTPSGLANSGVTLDHRPAGGMIDLVNGQQVIARLHTKGKKMVIDVHDDRDLDTIVAIALALDSQNQQFWLWFIPFIIILLIRNLFF